MPLRRSAPSRAGARAGAIASALALSAAIAVAAPGAAFAGTGPVGGDDLGTSGTAVHLAVGEPAPPVVPAAGWLVADLDTGQILAAHDPHGLYAPASTLKILTALTLMPVLDPARTLTATSAQASVDGTRVGIVPAKSYRVSQLLRGMLMVSGNDTAELLASAVGSEAQVAASMTTTAHALGADDTVAKTVTGLDAPGQITSAYDLALIARAALNIPAFRTYVATRRATFAGTNVRGFEIDNHNPLLGRYRGSYGVKNGYTVAARASYVGTAVRGGHHLMITMIRAAPNFTKPAEALLNWGFRADGMVRPVGRLIAPGEDRQPVATAQKISASTTRASLSRAGGGPGGAAYALLGAGAAVVLVAALRVRASRRRRGRRYRRRGLSLPR